jgi:hypothetical protein
MVTEFDTLARAVLAVTLILTIPRAWFTPAKPLPVRVQETVWPDTEQFHPFCEKGEELLIVNWAGTTSVMVAPDGKSPEYRGVRTKLKVLFTKTGSARLLVFTTETSLPAVTGVLVVAVLLSVRLSGDAAPADTVATFVSVLPPATPAMHWMGPTLLVEPFARAATLQVTTCPAEEHPPGNDPVMVQLGGNVSVITREDALSGPLLVRVSV